MFTVRLKRQKEQWDSSSEDQSLATARPTVTCRGCRRASSTVKREVSLTRDGFPSLASMYRPATDVAFLAE